MESVPEPSSRPSRRSSKSDKDDGRKGEKIKSLEMIYPVVKKKKNYDALFFIIP